MKKTLLISIVLAPFLHANIPSINENNETMEIKKITNKELNLNTELDYLFENTKFPTDDYIYKAGFRKSKNEPIIIKNENNKTKPEIIKENPIIKQIPTEEKPKINLEEVKEKLKTNETNFQQEKQRNEEFTQKTNYKKMLRDELLANRTSQIKDFSNDSKYGVDGFSNQKSIDIATNEHKLTRMIRAGRLIPAILTTAISSDLAGIVTAQIEQDIYAAHGRAVLIPRGSKAIGFYQSNTAIGREKLEIKWREIITPQGINILLTNAIVADNIGMTGANGVVNNKYWDRYALPLGISTISNALLLGIASKFDKKDNGSTQVNEYQQNIFSGVQKDINSVVDDILQQHQSIKPTIEIQSGSRIFLVPTNHMWFSKPKNNEVLMKYFIE